MMLIVIMADDNDENVKVNGLIQGMDLYISSPATVCHHYAIPVMVRNPKH